MLEQKTVKINKQSFTLQQLPATKGLEAALAIVHILRGASEGFTDEYVLNIQETKVNIAKVVSGVIGATDIKETPKFIKQLIIDSVVKPEFDEDTYEDTFAGEYSLMFEVLSEIVEHNKFMELVKKNLSPLIMGLLVTE